MLREAESNGRLKVMSLTRCLFSIPLRCMLQENLNFGKLNLKKAINNAILPICRRSSVSRARDS